MACIKEANTYTVKNVIWKLEDDTESLIDQEGTENFYVKIGAGTAPYKYGTDPADGITNVVNKKAASKGTFNFAGQRVAKGYKGLVVTDGVKYMAK